MALHVIEGHKVHPVAIRSLAFNTDRAETRQAHIYNVWVAILA
jgi:hypothetical protein